MNPPEIAIIKTESTQVDRVSIYGRTLAEALRRAADYIDLYGEGGELVDLNPLTPLAVAALYHQGPSDIPHWTVELTVIAGLYPLIDKEPGDDYPRFDEQTASRPGR